MRIERRAALHKSPGNHFLTRSPPARWPAPPTKSKISKRTNSIAIFGIILGSLHRLCPATAIFPPGDCRGGQIPALPHFPHAQLLPSLHSPADVARQKPQREFTDLGFTATNSLRSRMPKPSRSAFALPAASAALCILARMSVSPRVSRCKYAFITLAIAALGTV